MNNKVKIILIGLLVVIIIVLLFLLGIFPKKVTTTEEPTGKIIKQVGQRVINFVLPQKKSVTTPEAKTSPCLILEDKFCSQGKFVHDKNGFLVGLGFKLPKGTKIYAPFKGEMESADTKVQIESGVYRDSELLDITKDDWGRQPTRTIFTALGFHQLPEANKEIFAKGELFALAGESPVDSKLGDYNLILNFRVFYNRTNQWYTDINLLRQYFTYFISEQ